MDGRESGDPERVLHDVLKEAHQSPIAYENYTRHRSYGNPLPHCSYENPLSDCPYTSN